MTLYRKFFFATFFTATFLLILALGGAYRTLKVKVTENYQIHYQSLAKTIANSIEKLESGTEDTMKVALYALRYFTAEHPIPSDAKLRVMQRNLRVSNIEFVRSDGTFIRSTKYDTKALPNLFSFCSGYQELFSGESQYDHTPLMPSVVDQRVQKFALMPTLDGKYVINIGTDVSYITDLLRSAMDGDKNIAGMALYTPNGKVLGSFRRQGDRIAADTKAANINTEVNVKSNSYEENEIEISTKLKATNDSCCECVVKGLVDEPSGNFYYILKTQVSLNSLRDSIANVGWTLMIVALATIIVAFFMSTAIAKKLTNRIDQINRKAEKIRDSQDLGLRLNVDGNDEISSMGKYFDEMLQRLQESQTRIINAEKDRVIATVSTQVAHDIRSPLAALAMVEKDLAILPEDTRLLIRNAIVRIQDIATQLFRKNTLEPSPLSEKREEKLVSRTPDTAHLITTLIDNIVSEKRVQFRSRIGIEINSKGSSDSYGIFSYVNSIEFNRIISNLINNSVESIEDTGQITVSTVQYADTIGIKISDTGRGIPKSILKELGKRGQTFGKIGGSGLGLFHAKTAIEAWGGRMEIQSTFGIGTSIELTLPKAPPPSWFVPILEIPTETQIVILDDDTSIHQIWRGRLDVRDQTTDTIELVHLATPSTFIDWYKTNCTTPKYKLYLIDFELLGFLETGLDIIEQLGIGPHSILVTSRYEETAIRQKCEQLGVRLIPKGMAGFVPIRRQVQTKYFDAVLIDNDPLIHLTWNRASKMKNLKLKIFHSANEFLDNKFNIDSRTSIYIDSDLGDGIKGEIVAEQIYSFGYKNIYLTTGAAPDTFPKQPWIKKIIGKDPPWNKTC